MNEQPQPNRATGRRGKPQLYRTMLSIAAAALLAAWLPFSIVYIDALTKHTALVSKPAPTGQTASAGVAHATRSPTPVTTRTS